MATDLSNVQGLTWSTMLVGCVCVSPNISPLVPTMQEEEFPIEPYRSGNCNAPELARITKSWNVDPP
jgi:hypothetical protein